MDLLQFGVGVVGGLIGGTTDIVGLVVGSALGAMGIAPATSHAVANVVGTIAGGTVATAGIVMTAYGGIKTAIWALFKFSPEEWLLNHVEAIGYRIGKKGKAIVVAHIHEADARQYIANLTKTAMDRFEIGVEKAISE